MDKLGYNYLIEQKTLWEKEKLLIMSNFSFSHKVFKSCLVLMRQNEYLWSKGLTKQTEQGLTERITDEQGNKASININTLSFFSYKTKMKHKSNPYKE